MPKTLGAWAGMPQELLAHGIPRGPMSFNLKLPTSSMVDKANAHVKCLALQLRHVSVSSNFVTYRARAAHNTSHRTKQGR